MMNVRRWLIIVLITLASFRVFGASALAAESTQRLNLNPIQQIQPNWCWAANSVAILQHYGVWITQCKFVSYVKTGQETPENCPNDGGWRWESQQGLDHFGVTSVQYTGARSFSTIKSEIDQNRPIYVELAWLGSGDVVTARHVQTIDGYYENTNYPATMVYYIESLQGQTYSMDYSDFAYTPGPNGRKWEAGLYQFAKKP